MSEQSVAVAAEQEDRWQESPPAFYEADPYPVQQGRMPVQDID